MQKQQGNAPVTAPKAETKQPEPEAMEVDGPISTPTPSVEETKLATDEQKKKKKKTSYKNLLKDMMKSSPERDIEKEKEKLRQVTGGGQFQKIEKI